MALSLPFLQAREAILHCGGSHGEVKWLARPATSAALRRMGLDLSANGRPPFATGREEIRRLLFVPRIERGARPPEGFEALDAASVLAVLREPRTA